MTTKQATTPVRNNYAAQHTPIASAKRPRSSLERPNSTMNSSTKTTSGLKSPDATSCMSACISETAIHMSPMHPARPLETTVEDEGGWRKFDAIFSPIVSLLSPSSNEADDQEEAAAVTDEDVNMEDVPKSPETPTTVEKKESEEEATVQEEPSSEVEEDEEDEFNPYLFIKHLPPYDEVKRYRPKITLPKKDPKDPPITLVLDLDETLVHCTVEDTDDPDLVFPVVFNSVTYDVKVRKRPCLREFLEMIHDKFEVVVFTASQQVYADELLNRIDPDGKYIKYRLFRDSCLAVEGNFLKDLNVLGRDLSKTVLVDNSPHAFGYQIENGIPIESWFDDKEDRELLKLEKFLTTLHKGEDVRTIVTNHFETYKKVQGSYP